MKVEGGSCVGIKNEIEDGAGGGGFGDEMYATPSYSPLHVIYPLLPIIHPLLPIIHPLPSTVTKIQILIPAIL